MGLQTSERGNPGLVRIVGQKQTHFGQADGLPNGHVWAVHVARDGGVWAGTENGIARFKAGRFVTAVAPEQLPSAHVLAIASAVNNDIWIGTTLGLARLRNGQVDIAFADKGVTSLTLDEHRSMVWASTTKGVVGVRGLQVVRTMTMTDGLPAPSASALLIDHEHSLWAGTTQGLVRLPLNASEPADLFRKPQGLPDNHINALYEDREGGIWAGGRVGGACRITRKSVWDLDAANGVQADAAYSVVRAGDASMWLSSSTQVAQFVEGRLAQLFEPIMKDGTELRAITEAPDGTIWATTTGAKLMRVQKASAALRPVLTEVSLSSVHFANGQRSILFDAQGYVWLGRSGGGLLRARSAADLGAADSWQTLTPDSGVCQGETTAAFLGLDRKTLWFGTEGAGATRWNGNHARCLTTKDGLGANIATSFFEDPDDHSVWIGTRNDVGLARFRDGQVKRVRGNQGLVCDSIAGLVADGSRNLWTMCGAGVGRTRLVDLNAVADGRADFAMTLGFASGRSWETTVGTNPTGAIDSAGRLWWATLGGVTVIAPPTDQIAPVSRTPNIRSVEIGGVTTAVANPVVTSVFHPRVTFEFATPSFLPALQTVFRHRLHNFDRAWKYSFDTKVTYPSLPAGKYQLQMGVSDGFGGWSTQEATLDLQVKLPLQRTVWFWVAAMVCLAGLAIGGVKLRERALRVRHAATLAERTRIARDLHDVIGQAFAGIGLLLDAIRTTRSPSVEPLKEIADRARQVLDHCDGNIRTAIWELRQKGGDDTLLIDLIARIVDETRRSVHGAGPVIRFEPRRARGTVSELIRHELPHVVREALSNAIKHSHARTIEVKVVQNAAEVSVVVQDDGQGMSVDARAGTTGNHFGVLGMRERARRMAGALSLEDAPGGGTMVQLRVPLTKQGSNNEDAKL
ncbi:MAG: two-component regulator propeller domain-containing protein [Deltaproteobacteria bacterium]|nr:two-component regulator propeller domain-containing protein [Deltaproteobacteria bacterium]